LAGGTGGIWVGIIEILVLQTNPKRMHEWATICRVLKKSSAMDSIALTWINVGSPIYPATPGKELLGKPVYTVSLQIYAASEQDRNYLQQSLSYAQTRPSLPPPKKAQANHSA
jgi:hypothetical protein